MLAGAIADAKREGISLPVPVVGAEELLVDALETYLSPGGLEGVTFVAPSRRQSTTAKLARSSTISSSIGIDVPVWQCQLAQCCKLTAHQARIAKS